MPALKVDKLSAIYFAHMNSFLITSLLKMFVQPEKVNYPKDPHTFLFKDAFYGVNENGHRVDLQRYPCHVDRIQINHYFTRSMQEWKTKLSPW